MRQLTLAALYGPKNSDLAELIRHCQSILASAPGTGFAPYDIAQVHATIVSLERVPDTTLNLNFARYRGVERQMDFSGWLDWLRNGGWFPLRVQIAGFADNVSPFTSRGRTPYQRSFQFSGSKPVVIGWPTASPGGASSLPRPTDAKRTGVIYPDTLDHLRRGCQQFGILHRYHHDDDSVDNDFYFRIGVMDPTSLAPAAREIVDDDVHRYLASRKPLMLDVKLSDLYIVAYEDNTLPWCSTTHLSLANSQLTPDGMWDLYR